MARKEILNLLKPNQSSTSSAESNTGNTKDEAINLEETCNYDDAVYFLEGAVKYVKEITEKVAYGLATNNSLESKDTGAISKKRDPSDQVVVKNESNLKTKIKYPCPICHIVHEKGKCMVFNSSEDTLARNSPTSETKPEFPGVLKDFKSFSLPPPSSMPNFISDIKEHTTPVDKTFDSLEKIGCELKAIADSSRSQRSFFETNARSITSSERKSTPEDLYTSNTSNPSIEEISYFEECDSNFDELESDFKKLYKYAAKSHSSLKTDKVKSNITCETISEEAKTSVSSEEEEETL